MTLKLYFLIFIMDLATLAAFPFVFMLGKVRQLSIFIKGKIFVPSTAVNPGTLDG
jgi:hypothetical protein